MKRTAFILLGAVIVMTAIHPLPAQESRPMVRRGGMQDLTDAQQEQIKALQLELEESITPLKSEVRVLDAELKKLLIADGASQRDIDRKIDEIASLQTQMRKLQVKNNRSIRNLLTDEQKVQFDRRIVEGPRRIRGRPFRGRTGMRMNGHRGRIFPRRGRGQMMQNQEMEASDELDNV